MGLYKIKADLERVKALLDKGDEHSLRYASLDLRFCMEKVAYRQLQEYGAVIPGSIAKQWKPDQIMKLLASFDPMSEMEGRFSIGPVGTENPENVPEEEWVTLGETRAIPWRKFRTLYNKLGSYLHAPVLKQDSPTPKILTRVPLDEIVELLEVVSQASIVFAFKAVIKAKCTCGTMLYVGQSEFDNDEIVACANTQCNSLFLKRLNDAGEQILQPAPVIWIKCTECDAPIPQQPKDIWRPVKCPACPARFKIDLAYSRAEILD